METTHVVAIFLLRETLGKTLLPHSIEAQDFQTGLSATTNEKVPHRLLN